MRKNIFTKLIVFAVAAALLAPMTAFAADINKHTFKFAFQNSKEHPQGQGVAKFAELVEQKSNGKMTVKLYPSGMLGGDLQTVSALQGGTIDFTVLNAGLLVGIVPGFGIFDFPFMFNDEQEADAVVDGSFGKMMFDKLPAKGLVGLGYWELGFRNVTNNVHPITKLEDFAGIKLRVLQSPVFIDTFNTLGCNTVPLPWPEVYTALEQHVVDGQENPVTNVQFASLFEVQKYFSFTKHIYSPQSSLVSKKTWDKLTDAERAIIVEAEQEAKLFQRKANRAQMDKSLEFVKTKMAVNEIAPAEMDRIRAAAKPVIEKNTPKVGQDVVDAFNAAIAKVRGK
ncbi:TRAP transporter substrate-binding protein [Pelobacter seleniigenes]|uniref:TRAP transporter substrate-binding protein n=1 Tax=Pelobacter seleniigenes TaxID=407188 RepID=UPI0004A74637|nr:TRAP transporter substrate-binding protein [Pelobacter seleniigenes]